MGVECNVISCNWSYKLSVVEDSESLNCSVHVWHEIFDALVMFFLKVLCSLCRNNIVHQIPSNVFSDQANHVEHNSLFKKLLGWGMSALFHVLNSSLEHVSLSKCLGEALNLIRDMVKPNIEESLSLLHDPLLQSFTHKFNLGMLSEEDQVAKSLKCGDTVKLGNLSDWALSQLW